MLVMADGVQRAGWTLRNPETGAIAVELIGEDEAYAYRLKAGMRVHHPELGMTEVVPVLITITTPDH